MLSTGSTRAADWAGRKGILLNLPSDLEIAYEELVIAALDGEDGHILSPSDDLYQDHLRLVELGFSRSEQRRQETAFILTDPNPKTTLEGFVRFRPCVHWIALDRITNPGGN